MPWRILLIGLAVFAAAPVLLGRGTMQRLLLPAAESLAPSGVFRLPATPDDRFVVLTIDDGPSSRTGEMLDLLDRYGATATMFVHTDHITTPERRAALLRAVASGHELANHLPADARADRLSEVAFTAAFDRADRTLGAFGAVRYFRPPHGRYDPVAMDPVLTASGYDRPLAAIGSDRRYILASFLPWDAGGATETGDPVRDARVARRYADELSSNLFPGAIVVFHDGEDGGRDARLAATFVSLERFLITAGEKGFDVVSLSDGVARIAAGTSAPEGHRQPHAAAALRTGP